MAKNVKETLKDAIRTIEAKEKRRDALLAELASLERDIAKFYTAVETITGKAAKGRGKATGGKRGGSESGESLLAILSRVVPTDKAIGIGEIATLVEDTGYVSKAAKPKNIVGHMLATNPSLFAKEGRGLYKRIEGGEAKPAKAKKSK